MTTIQRSDPFREMRHFARLMNSPVWANPRWGDPLEQDVDQPAEAWSIPMDVSRDDQQLTVTASLPGFAAADVDVSISPDRVLTVKASRQTEAARATDVARATEEYLLRERRSGRFSRSIRLPGDLNLDAATVNLEHGVLTVAVPVAAAAQTRRLHIADGADSDAADSA